MTRMPVVVVVGCRVPMGQRLALPILGRQSVDVGGRRKRSDCERRSQDDRETPKKRHHCRHRTTPEVRASVPTLRDLNLSIGAGRQTGCRSRCRRALVEENAYNAPGVETPDFHHGLIVTFSHSSHVRLTDRDLDRFPGPLLFHKIARAVCHAGCLPRKELYEAWETARRVRRLFRGGRVVDMGGGHGLLAHILLILDDSSPDALVVDLAPPPSGTKLQAVLVATWPRLAGRVRIVTAAIGTVTVAPTDLVVSSHACGGLTDQVLDRASAVGARVAVLPCCHDLDGDDNGSLSGWLDGALEIDVMRAVRLRQRGYRVWTQRIPVAITPKNRLLLGTPMGKARPA